MFSQRLDHRDLVRNQGEPVWIQNEEANSKEWLECVVARREPDPLLETAAVYQLAIRDNGRLFADGQYVPAHRLYDKPPNKQPVKSKWTLRPENDLGLPPSVSGQRTRGPDRRLDAMPATGIVQSPSYDDKSHFDDKALRGHGNSLLEDVIDASVSKDMKHLAGEAKFQPGTSSGSYDTGPAFSYIKDQMTRVVAEKPNVIQLQLNWDVAAILRGQNAPGRPAPGCLSNTIVYNGTPTMCYATTVRQYAKKLWPAVCSPVLGCLERALSSSDYGRSKLGWEVAEFHDIAVGVKLDGATTSVSIERGFRVATYPQAMMSEVRKW